MVRVRLKYVVEDVDRHGSVRLYFRRKGAQKIRLRGVPGSEEFMQAYKDALNNVVAAPRQAKRVIPGSFRALCISYLATAEFRRLDAKTQSWRRRHLDAVCLIHADKPFALMQAKHVRSLRDELVDRPAASRDRLKTLRALFQWAAEAGQAESDPTIGVKFLTYRSAGFHTWSSGEVERFESRHPVGSKARLAMAILLYTACRREDVVRLGPQHIRDGRIRFRQAKNEHRAPIEIDIPVHADLSEAISAAKSHHLTFLVTAYGRPFTSNGFGNKFRRWCDEAGLPHCSAHGLRKATAARLAERGATPHEIMSITGHRTLAEVERYTRAAKRLELANTGMAKLKS